MYFLINQFLGGRTKLLFYLHIIFPYFFYRATFIVLSHSKHSISSIVARHSSLDSHEKHTQCRIKHEKRKQLPETSLIYHRLSSLVVVIAQQSSGKSILLLCKSLRTLVFYLLNGGALTEKE